MNDDRHDSTPLVSVVCATYNRPEHLEVAVRSVLAQTYRHWELFVIGDRCDERTGLMMNRFDDARISYHNRAENHGEQSVPNNDGVAMSNGALVAYLNHDDVWLPEHLANGVATLERTAADIVYTPALMVTPDDTVFGQPEPVTRRGRLNELAPATTWIVRRSIIDTVGPWRSAFDMHHAPSGEWLVRALDSGAEVRSTEVTTAVIFQSGRPGSYTTASTDTVPLAGDVLERGLDALRPLSRYRPSFARRIWQRGWRSVSVVLAVVGHPYVFRTRLLARQRRYRNGDFIRDLRERRGLQRDV